MGDDLKIGDMVTVVGKVLGIYQETYGEEAGDKAGLTENRVQLFVDPDDGVIGETENVDVPESAVTKL